ncbi:MAG TPA: glycoside hydrolase family 140 protein [Chitinophagaceae bacterium]|nr:glycoside hydrolase family 140 protein [Chitinophagaceae bacterium]
MIRLINFIILCSVVIILPACDLVMYPISKKIHEIDNRGVKGGLVIDESGHYLQYKDGNPFFWLGDTGWELFHRLRKEEIEKYIENRRQKGFNVIQAVIFAEFDGLRKPNQYGEVPLKNLDPTKPNEKYFELVDWTVKLAKEKDMFMGLLPTWGDKVTKMWGEGPVVFDQGNAYIYGYFLGKRYQYFRNIIWILGGDRPPVTDSADWRPKWRAMAKGIRDGSGHGETLFTYHISGGEHSTSYDLHNEDWLHINTMQSGHGSGHDVPVWNWIERDRKLFPLKPTLDLEPNYEDHPVNPWPKWDSANGYFNDYDVRKQTYRSVFAGACGVTYGHHAVWQFWSSREEKINHADRYWTEAIDRPGAFQVGYLRKLIESRSVTGRVPDQSIIRSGQGDKAEYATAFRDKDNGYCMVYLPVGKQVSLDLSFIAGKEITVWLFNPRTGSSSKPATFAKTEVRDFAPPETGVGKDWVLVIDDAEKKYREPGK